MICNLKADVQNMFRSIAYNYLSSLCFVTYCFRSKKGRPTYVESSSDGTGLHPIRCRFLRFGSSQSPAVAQFCLLQCIKQYYSDHSPLNQLELFYFNICKNIIQHYTFFDDLEVCVYLSHVFQYCKLTDTPLPTLPGNCATFSLDEARKIMKNLKDFCKPILYKISVQLLKILNHGGFRLKQLSTNDEVLQKQFDKLIQSQTVGDVDRNHIEEHKPSMKELKEQLHLLSPSSHPSSLVSVQSENESGVNHLGHCYKDQAIYLKKQTLSFPCLIDGRNVRSPDFSSFHQYQDYMHIYKVKFTKRTIASLISTNADVTGRFLVLFKSKVKALMRTFFKSNRNAAWDSPVHNEIIPQVHNSINTYFALVGLELMEPLLAGCSSTATIVACSDSSEILGCFSISIIFEHEVNGIRTAEASHLCLQSYTPGLDIICIVTLEFVAFLRMLVELKIYLEELDSLGLNIPSERVLCLSDSSILIRLLRTKLNLLQKKASHQVSKSLLLLHDIGLDPHKNLAFADQTQILSWFPDILSRPHLSETSEQVLKKQQLLMDTNWLTKEPFPHFRGVEFNLKSLS